MPELIIPIYGSFLEVYGLFLATEAAFYAIATSSALNRFKKIKNEYEKYSKVKVSETTLKQMIINERKQIDSNETVIEERIFLFRNFTVAIMVIIGVISYLSIIFGKNILLSNENISWFKDATYYCTKVFATYMLIKILWFWRAVYAKIEKIKNSSELVLKRIQGADDSIDHKKSQLQKIKLP